MTLWDADEGREYMIIGIDTDDDELSAFLFSLGCYGGGTIAVVSKLKKTRVIALKDGRYSIDRALAESILI